MFVLGFPLPTLLHRSTRFLIMRLSKHISLSDSFELSEGKIKKEIEKISVIILKNIHIRIQIYTHNETTEKIQLSFSVKVKAWAELAFPIQTLNPTFNTRNVVCMIVQYRKLRASDLWNRIMPGNIFQGR